MNKKVMIVDDEPFVREIVRVKLRQFGIDVIEGATGPEALEKALRDKPDLILLDIMMPKMSGFEVCEKLKSHPETANIPILMLTARGEQTDKEKGERVGALDYIVKPFSPQKLAEKVMSIIGSNDNP